mmetsp:Transcript_19581/g.24697  ORF Transcript_19581/g.24697 Transcript_19581/m.24697 type:complete len:478 (+) Transcript_19581:102-1535(+)|eukprot:CAMPEP_0203696172 /NCGR_PEP_ID=MMETSP0091-20130426/7450_1 /ASSEMBLY_ACC=CAM_ASM_001089 /TAXON_ID=426623 /ORGANISM="Chaetoceros affinis, Strain CCMP159" /LENGTH=477 /DNA_ID=CAMNT_0050567899 /DNA_START=78 /DNA_END=1511 /DNA_ORIENTATION=+
MKVTPFLLVLDTLAIIWIYVMMGFSKNLTTTTSSNRDNDIPVPVRGNKLPRQEKKDSKKRHNKKDHQKDVVGIGGKDDKKDDNDDKHDDDNNSEDNNNIGSKKAGKRVQTYFPLSSNYEKTTVIQKSRKQEDTESIPTIPMKPVVPVTSHQAANHEEIKEAPSDENIPTTTTTVQEEAPIDEEKSPEIAQGPDVTPVDENDVQVDQEVLVNEGAVPTSDEELENWKNNVCTSIEDSICHEVFVVKNRKATFCSAAKVASTTTKTYFYNIADGSITIPSYSRYGVHEADWRRFHSFDEEAQKYILHSPEWTHIFFWRGVVSRFVSGFLDKVVHDCKNHENVVKRSLAIHHYVQYGFSCEKHNDLEAFISFMETVPSHEGHFHAQSSLCSIGKYPFTDFIQVDKNLSENLKLLSTKLGVKHPSEDERSSSHSTKAQERMVQLFKEKPYLVQRVLDMFKVDCENIPHACDVDDLMAAISP